MDLLTKAIVVAVVIAVVIVSAYYLLRQSSANQVTKAQATSLILFTEMYAKSFATLM